MLRFSSPLWNIAIRYSYKAYSYGVHILFCNEARISLHMLRFGFKSVTLTGRVVGGFQAPRYTYYTYYTTYTK